MPNLRVRPARASQVHNVTPESAGWSYVGFSTHDLKAGESLAARTADREVCLVLVSGKAHIIGDGQDFGVLGERETPFEAAPWSVYVPANSSYTVTAEGDAEVAVCSAPGIGGKYPARVISPQDCGNEIRGVGTNTRYVRNILPDSRDVAESLLVVEVITPPGHWSSYPPHRHDEDDLPHQSYLEETYYHRLNPSRGYAHQRVYTDDRSLDESITIEDRDVVLVPRGYHPCAAAHGYELYYLNVMAGPTRKWVFHNDPDHEWLMVKR